MIAVTLQYLMESGDCSKNNSRADWTKEEPKQSLLTGRFLFHNVLVYLRRVASGGRGRSAAIAAIAVGICIPCLSVVRRRLVQH
jgi:hypothetical protein